uniref:Protein FAM234A n=1 Tax=Pogona vitticeps TaxID=103695 RepID=A0ABM5EZG9_9SAUR
MESKDPETEIHPLKNEEGKAAAAAEGKGTAAPGAGGLPRKAGRLSRWRTAAFFLSLFLCLLVVFAFSFIIPCPVRPVSQKTWSRSYDNAATYPFLALADVDGDGVQDVLFAFQAAAGHLDHHRRSFNGSCPEAGLASPCAFVAAHSGTNGSTLWERPVGEDLLLMDCTLELTNTPACLLIGKPDFLAALDRRTGQALWQQVVDFGTNSTILSPLLKIPDINKDGVSDLLFFTSTGGKVTFLFCSGSDGRPIGASKVLHLPGCRGHLLHLTKSGALYVLFYSVTTVYAYSVEELFHMVLEDHHSTALKEDPHWELTIDRTTHQLSFLSTGEILSLAEVAKKAGASLLVARSGMLELVDGQRLGSMWVTDIPHIWREPVLGSFYPDEVDVLIESQVSPMRKKVLMVEGASGDIEWEVELLSQEDNPRAATLATADHRSAFLFWGLYPENTNGTGSSEEPRPWQPQKLYLFHPSLPNVLLEMSNSSEAIVAFEGVLFEHSRHACYVLLTGPQAGSPPGNVGLLKRKLKEDVASSRVIWLSRLAQDSDQNIRDRFYRMRYRSLR